MKLSRTQAKLLEAVIAEWRRRGIISEPVADTLRESYEIASFDWKRLAKYSFWISIASAAVAITALIADEFLEPVLLGLFGSVYIGYSAVFAAFAIALFYLGIHRKRVKPERVFSNEAVFLLGVLSLAVSIGFLGLELELEHVSLLFLFAAATYSLLGLIFPSKLVWIFALLSLGGWFGAETGYLSGWGSYYLGMNYPVRFVLFGAFLTAISHAFNMMGWRQDFFAPTRAVGLLYLFIALWLLSIFGNYGDMQAWYEVRQWELFYWSLLFAGVSLAAIVLGVRFEDKLLRGFGLTFLFINLYTRFFEYFWDHMHKAVFFALLAMSFWYLGSRTERIWSIGTAGKERDSDAPGA